MNIYAIYAQAYKFVRVNSWLRGVAHKLCFFAMAGPKDILFDKLMEATKVCSLGQITEALFKVGGQYRRNM